MLRFRFNGKNTTKKDETKSSAFFYKYNLSDYFFTNFFASQLL